MTERGRARRAKGAPEKPDAEIRRDIEALEIWNAERRLKERGLPGAWNALGWDLPAGPAKTRMTLALDPEVLGWFEALGPDFAARINAVLRIYMLGVQSREIDVPEHFDWRGAPV
ncbi:BrnA antitoxin family protein [Amaricoccus solimangrovi]|uniref:BrnA antitoxin family protein n=1 Tax=Amaricoccus solimangrovi TaxID=2589815 RepID=A0A501WWX9_9RHOB|nr:BrnA antitoxin family protein [Amaricoccus solimangrovi]TPE52940.1 BrnA antitoxin family protein [Amaricoccus solimangrovi]